MNPCNVKESTPKLYSYVHRTLRGVFGCGSLDGLGYICHKLFDPMYHVYGSFCAHSNTSGR